ncbi:PH domain protein [Penicillium brasilianum]|uniref:PH domain protein n=1 Tax=Penicillium brasilianum TaxID=104259 RepID=A0A1S9RV74_PENBI|nr:PH domain protein [Penicillium brasilianum]
MSGILWSLVGKRVLAESARNHFGTEDPYFEEVPASRLGKAFGKKTQKRRKAIPPGLSEKDAKVLTQVKRRAYRLDYALFSLCGVRFGWGSVIGLVPFIGDAADAALALMVVRTCEGIDGGLPPRLRMMMLINVIVDFFIGLVPFIGDVADAVYKCNTRNAVILEKHLREQGAKTLKKQTQRHDLPAIENRQEERIIDHSLPEEWDKQESGVVESSPPSYREHAMSGVRPADNADSGPARPPRAKKSRDSRRSSRWFGGSRQREDDLERGR